MKTETVNRLRHGQPLKLFLNKTFYQYQLNKDADRICWERYASTDKRNWIKQGEYFTLKSINQFIKSHENHKTD